MGDSDKSKAYIGDSFDFLRKSLNNLNIQQSTGPAPLFYPQANGQAGAVQPQAQQSSTPTTDKPKS